MRHAKRYSVTEPAPRRAFTRDGIDHAVPAQMNPEMLGRTWVGDITTKLNGMNPTDARAALRGIRNALDAYDSTQGFPARPEKVFSNGATSIEALQRTNDAFWENGGRMPTGDARPERSQLEMMQQRYDAFWASQPTFRLGREFGKG